MSQPDATATEGPDGKRHSGTLRLCFAIEHLVDGAGGGERVLRDVTGALADRGHEVEVVHFDETPGEPFYSFSERVRLTRLARTAGLGGRLARRVANLLHRAGLTRNAAGGWLAWRLVRRPLDLLLEAHLRETRPDVAVAFMPNAMGFLARAQVGFPMAKVASTHNTPVQELEIPSGAHFLYQRRANLRALDDFDEIAVLIPEFRDWYPERLRSRVRVIPNSIAAPSEPPVVPGREKLAISVGRLVPQKRHDLLLEAWARIRFDFPDWRLEIYGEGPLREALEARVRSLGLEGAVALMSVTRDIGNVYARARLMVHPSDYEGFPLVTGEALAHGVPVLGFADCTGLNHLVQDRVNGRLAPSQEDRAASFAAALGDLLSTPAALEALAVQAPASVEAYKLNPIINLWEEMLRDALHATLMPAGPA